MATRAKRTRLDDKDLADIIRGSWGKSFDYVYEKISYNNKSTEEIAKESYKATTSIAKLNDMVLKRLKMYDWFDSFLLVNTSIRWQADQDQANLFTNLDSTSGPRETF